MCDERRFETIASNRHPAAFQLVGAGLLIVAATYGFARYSYGLFVPEIKARFALSQAAVGSIGSLSYIGYLVATLLGTVLSHRMGARLPIVLGGMAAGIGMTMIALADSSLCLASGVMLAGCSPGLAYPPLPDAIKRSVKPGDQNRVYALINSGTGFGVMLSGPLALSVGARWQLAWLLFALIAFAATLWSLAVMPGVAWKGGANPAIKETCREQKGDVSLAREKLAEVSVVRLFASALLFGIVTSVYWVFSVDLVAEKGWSTSGYVLFWTLAGIAGIIGGAAGDIVTRYGVKRALRWSVIILASAIILPTVAAEFGMAFVLLSAIAFGAAFILITALYGIWSIACFPEAPTIGFGIAFFLISVGQLVSPPIAGVLAEGLGLPIVFQISAVASLLILMLLPPEDL